jgi:3-phosphoshikimate 1-carboxyvinyltransferase
VALKSELEKLGASVEITENSLSLKPNQKINPGISIKTYNDHRMAMAFAPLALKTEISIENPEVVSKSYPGFWEDLGKLRISGTNS